MDLRNRYWSYILLLLLPSALLLHLHSHLGLERHQATRDIQFNDDQLLPGSAELSAWSLNYDTAAADMIWLGAIFYASERGQMRHSRRGITEYADRIIDLDPYFYPIYYQHYSIRYELAVNPDLEDREAANRILITGLEHFPDDWKLARAIILNNVGNRFQRDPSDYIADLELALHYAQLAAAAPDAPAEMTALAITVRNRLEQQRRKLNEDNDTPIAFEVSPQDIELLLQRYIDAESPRQRRFIQRLLADMEAEDEIMERLSFQQERMSLTHRNRYPYLDLDIYTLVDSELYQYHRFPELGDSS